MLKNNGLINYVLDFGGKFLFLFEFEEGVDYKDGISRNSSKICP